MIKNTSSKQAESKRFTLRELDLSIGRFPTGKYNAITDVKGVKVGHVTHIIDNIHVPGTTENSSVRSGVTAIIPLSSDAIYKKRLVAGGFILNGIGEMTGLTQVMEWGWLETPILLTNTMSIGSVHQGVIQHTIKKHPELGTKTDVIIPVIGETDDSFLNDVRIPSVKPSDAERAIKIAKGGFVRQGSVGAGTGMTTLDFAGGIGTSSRVIPYNIGGYTVGVLVLSNFGHMVNLTLDGAVIGRDLERHYDSARMRKFNYGSIIVVVATDAPLLASQLNRIAKRAALGVGRAGSFAASTSGEIMIAFSTANKINREEAGSNKTLSINFISDAVLNPIYEAVIEATEEAIMNAIFCSGGVKGRNNHYSPPIPYDLVLKYLKR
ncbi:P1 family peptidase [bacterium]|nr:P1 family peptidase [bacterium]